MSYLPEHLSVALQLLKLRISPEAIRSQMTTHDKGAVNIESLKEVMLSYGVMLQLDQRRLETIPASAMPVVLVMKDERHLTIQSVETRSTDGMKIFTTCDEQGQRHEYPQQALQDDYQGYCWFIKRKSRKDISSELPEYTMEKSWFWKVIWRYRRYYYQVIVATMLINVLALVSSLYVMNVYDRVIPNQAFNTLWVLSIGVLLAMFFEFCAKMIRAYLTDVAGKKADLVISAALFRRVMVLDLAAKPMSSGAHANNLRDFEAVREFMTSASLLAFIDLPFVLLFVSVIYIVGGPLATVPLLIIPLVIGIGLVVQPKLARLTSEAMKEGSQRAGLAVEAIDGIETLKANNATNWAQAQWEHYNAVTSQVSLKIKVLSALVVNLSAGIQQSATVFLVIYGTYLIHNENVEARISMGALIACVILTGRTLSQLGQVSGLATRFQQTRSALAGLQGLVERPVDRDLSHTYISMNRLDGNVMFDKVSYAYPGTEIPVLNNLELSLRPGEKVAIIGRIGSGKSTLLRLMAGMLKPTDGVITFDNLDARQIDPADLRKAIYLFTQEPRLYLGTLRDNLEMGLDSQFVSDQTLMSALQQFGMDKMVNAHPAGLEMELGEHGQGLSGGQKQAIALARMTLRDPNVVLLDEPTSGLDQATENQALIALKGWARDKALVVVTHRTQVLEIVDRIVVVDAGNVVMDGTRAQVLDSLSKGIKLSNRPASPAE